jgi:hypothetical protein
VTLAQQITALATRVGQELKSLRLSKADDSAVVHLTGNETVSGTKTFGSAPVVPVGAAPGNPVRRDDARLGDMRPPLDLSVTDAKVAASAAIAESKLALAADAAAGTASRRTLGTGATQAAAGNHSHHAFPRGAIARGRRITNTPTVGDGYVGIVRVNAAIESGRLYRVAVPDFLLLPHAALNGVHVVESKFFYTTNGTNATTASPALDQNDAAVPGGLSAGLPTHYTHTAYFPAPSTGTLSVCFGMTRAVGGSTFYGLCAAAFPLDLLIEDCGVDPGSTGTNL